MKYIQNMTMRDKIDNDYKNALKSKDKNKISTYRLILSGVKDLDINNRSGPNKKETDDEDIKKLLKKMIKQRSESIEIYKKNNRSDLLEIEQGELDILSEYLPKQLSEADTEKICEEIIKNSGASSLKDMGKVMGELKITPLVHILSDSISSLFAPTFPMCGNVKFIICPAYDGSEIISWYPVKDVLKQTSPVTSP